jgi:hypothetical protein
MKQHNLIARLLLALLASAVLVQCSSDSQVDIEVTLAPENPLVSIADLTLPDPFPDNDLEESRDIKAPWFIIGLTVENKESEKSVVIQSYEITCNARANGRPVEFSVTANPGDRADQACKNLPFLLFVSPGETSNFEYGREFDDDVDLDDAKDEVVTSIQCGTSFYIESGLDVEDVDNYAWSCTMDIIGWVADTDFTFSDAPGSTNPTESIGFVQGTVDERLNKTIFFTTQ